MNEVGTEITKTTNPNEIYCRRLRCRCLLGEIVFDGQALEMGNVRLWVESPLTCSQCERPFRFIPKTLTEDLFTLDELENDYNF
jgi:hypothetical protein